MYAIMYFDGVKSGLWVLSEEAVAVPWRRTCPR
jgi:hypothetical protein